ncbi:hypothetical protein L596_001335 [Steinernema carpocapsae]|uniref:Uncharacterized protein n=1 Tax=Steinernema carpocapsae TaxID=34508 RepID=A0A4V6I7B9_STECR|nr:hypothetical protein L596_001335 [Steinernema carpocapsae]
MKLSLLLKLSLCGSKARCLDILSDQVIDRSHCLNASRNEHSHFWSRDYYVYQRQSATNLLQFDVDLTPNQPLADIAMTECSRRPASAYKPRCLK